MLKKSIVLLFIAFSLLSAQDKEKKDILQNLFPFTGYWKINYASLVEENYIYGTGNADIKMVLDQTYLSIEYRIEMGDGLYQCQTLIGYDHSKKVYLMYLFDNSARIPQYAEGVFDDKNVRFMFTSKEYNKLLKTETQIKYIYSWDRDNKFTYEVYKTPEKTEVMTYKMSYIKTGDREIPK